MSILGLNWKTNLSSIITGFLTLVLGIPTFISAITAWSNHLPVDWRSVLVSTALAVITAGLGVSKDATTHSTEAQVEQATVVAKTEAVADAKASAAQTKLDKGK